MAEHPEQGKIGKGFSVEQALQVKFHKGLPAQAGVVPQDAQDKPVGNKAPQVRIGTVQKLLHQRMRAALGSPGNAPCSPVHIHTAAHKVDGRMQPEMGNGVGFFLTAGCCARTAHKAIFGTGRDKPPVAKLGKKRKQQFFPCQPCSRVSFGQIVAQFGKTSPHGQHFLP